MKNTNNNENIASAQCGRFHGLVTATQNTMAATVGKVVCCKHLLLNYPDFNVTIMSYIIAKSVPFRITFYSDHFEYTGQTANPTGFDREATAVGQNGGFRLQYSQDCS